ncbi:MAG: helix-turn-helix transcriptional regulator [Pseudonocardiaceae bacterium]
MGQRPRELTPLESALHSFGAELRYWRTLRELSQAGLGQLTHDSSALISKIEKAERFPSLALARRLDAALATEGVLERLWPQVEQERTNRTLCPSLPVDHSEPIPADLGLLWPATAAATVEVVGKLWRADMERRSVLLSATWVASAFAEPVREWLLNRTEELLQDRPGRAVNQSDIDALRSMCEAFTDADLRLGGGYARSTLMHYVSEVVLPLLHGSYRDAIGRELMAATSRLCDLCAFMSFDSGMHGLAQRYFIQALRLAQASRNRMLGAHILADMSNQAHHLGNTTMALELATAGYRTALNCGSLSTAAKCAALQSRAHALRGEQRACAQTFTIAEKTLDRAVPTGGRTWVMIFTDDQLIAQRLYVAGDLGRYKDVQRIAPEALAFSSESVRRQVLYTTALAASYLPAEGNPHSDVDRACELLGQVVTSFGSLRSARSMERFNAVRRALAPYAQRPSVQEFEDRYRTTTMAGFTQA